MTLFVSRQRQQRKKEWGAEVVLEKLRVMREAFGVEGKRCNISIKDVCGGKMLERAGLGIIKVPLGKTWKFGE